MTSPSVSRVTPSPLSRRSFLGHAAASAIAAAVPATASAAPAATRRRPRVGAVAYAYNYTLGLFGAYAKRSGEKWDVFKFLEKTREAGGEVAQIYFTMVDKLDEAGLRRVRALAERLDLRLELHGGGAQRKDFARTLQQAAALGIKMVGCSFGMLMRPARIATLDAWDQHLAACRARLRQLVDDAQPLGLTIGVENHLDFTVEELRDLVQGMNSPHAGVLFDIGNTVGTLDDPSEAAEILGPLVVALHYKDFAIEETPRGFRLTMVPLGAGSLNLPEITQRLRKHVPPDLPFAIELINGQQLDVNWLEDRFWTAFRPKPAREIAATLRHIRGQTIDRAEFKPQSELDRLPHDARVQLEHDRITRSIAHLKNLLAPAGTARVI